MASDDHARPEGCISVTNLGSEHEERDQAPNDGHVEIWPWIYSRPEPGHVSAGSSGLGYLLKCPLSPLEPTLMMASREHGDEADTWER